MNVVEAPVLKGHYNNKHARNNLVDVVEAPVLKGHYNCLASSLLKVELWKPLF